MERAIGDLDRGAEWRETFEALLRALDATAAEHLQLTMREGRGSVGVSLASTSGAVAFLGDPLSGTPVALAALGHRVLCMAEPGDREHLRARLAAHRNHALAPGRIQVVVAADGRLPVPNRGVSAVFWERGGPLEASVVRELQRGSADELLWIGRNRFAYKRASGVRGVFRVPTPMEFLRAGLWPRGGERSLRGWRAVAGTNFARPKVYALYPDALDHSQIAAADGPTPRLLIGPKERANRSKVIARRVGLFKWLTPSYALHAQRRGTGPLPTGLERRLAQIAERLGTSTPGVEHVVSSRGSNIVVLTRPPCPKESSARNVAGWCLHIPLNPAQGRQVLRHARRLKQLESRVPGFPAPRLLGLFRLDGTLVCCETRIQGWNATQISGEEDPCARLFLCAARQLAHLAEPSATELDDAELARLLGHRVDVICDRTDSRSTERALRRLGDEVRERLAGKSLRRTLMHADLRSKHVQVNEEGAPTAYLDWGCSSWHDLPYFDLLHLIAHEAKQARGLSAGESWDYLRSSSALRPHDRQALEDYAARLGLDEEIRGALVLVYPILVAAQAESHWDYSRPNWVHRQFGL